MYAHTRARICTGPPTGPWHSLDDEVTSWVLMRVECGVVIALLGVLAEWA